MLVKLLNEEILSTQNLEDIKGGGIIGEDGEFSLTFIITEDGEL